MPPALRSVLKPILALVLAYALVIGGVVTSFAGAAGGLQFPVCSAGSALSDQGPADPSRRDTAAHDCCLGACSAAAPALPAAAIELDQPRRHIHALRENGEPFALKPVALVMAPRGPPAAV